MTPESEAYTCKAFPERIPNVIIWGHDIHENVMAGQVGEYVLDPTEPDVFAMLFPDIPILKEA